MRYKHDEGIKEMCSTGIQALEDQNYSNHLATSH